MDVLAIERRDERAVETLDDFMRQEVALVLDFLDLVRLVPDRMVGREHLLEERGAALQLVGQRLKIGVELLFPRNQPERHLYLLGEGKNLRILADPFTRPLHRDCSGPVYHLLPRWL